MQSTSVWNLCNTFVSQNINMWSFDNTHRQPILSANDTDEQYAKYVLNVSK